MLKSTNKMIDYDPDADNYIYSVYCLGRQLRPGDIVSIPETVDKSSYTPEQRYEVISIARALDRDGKACWRGVIRWDFGPYDDCTWSDGGGSGLRYCVVGGDKILAANLTPSSVVYVSGLGWDYRVGRWE